MSIGTFGSFTQARLAVYAAQTGLTVTGNNISNVNTKGYTRQRLDQKSLYNAGADRYYATTDVKVGQGVLCYGLSQLRDPYLDIQYRSKSADVGAMDAVLNGLQGIQQILDEVGKGGEITEGKEFGIVAAQFREIYKALNNLTDETGHDAYDIQVRSACDKLVTMLRSYSRGLEEHYNNTVIQFEQNVTQVNTILTNIRTLNENIRQADIYGDDALEMRDERNLLIDQLSEYVKIDVQYSMEEIGMGSQVEKLTIRLDNANPDSSVHTDETVLIDGIYAAQLSIAPVLNKAAYKYMEADGTLTNNEARAKVPQRNPDSLLDPDDPDYDGVNLYLDKGGNPTANEADANIVTKENPDYDKTEKNDGLLYMKADGKTPTATFEEAAHNPNFDITVSELLDRSGRVLYTLSAGKEQVITPAEFEASGGTATTVTDPATGVITITTFREELSKDIARNPDWIKGSTTAYKYLTRSGTGTNNEDEAAKIYSPNLNYDPKKPHGADNPRYLDEKNQPTDDPQKAARVPQPNPDHDDTKISGYRYVLYGSKDKNPLTLADYTNDLKLARGPSVYYQQEYQKIPSTAVKLDDNDLYGKLQAQRELLTESGEFSSQDTIDRIDENAITKRGIPYYQKSLDLLAHTFATEFNKANQGYLVNPDGQYLDGAKADGSTLPPLVNAKTGEEYVLNRNDLWDKPAVKDPEDKNTYVPQWVKDELADYGSVENYLAGLKTDGTQEPARGAFIGGNLFSNNGNTNDADNPPITASNISISLQWGSGAMIVNSFVCPTGSSTPASTDSDNIITNLTSLFYRNLEFRPDTVPYDGVTGVRSEAMFTGKLEDMWLNMGTVLGNDMSIASTKLDNFYDTQVSLDTSRDSVSAVDFNDEAMNLMMYAKAYNAACRLMTTIDSVLDKLINNTGITT